NAMIACVAAALLASAYPLTVILAWLGAMVAVTAGRLLLLHRHQQDADIWQPRRWRQLFTAGAIATGVLWGVLGSVVFFTADAGDVLFVAFVLGGVSAGAAVRDSEHLPAFYGFMLPAVVPMVLAFATRGTLLSAGMSLMLTAFAVILALMAQGNN